MSLGSHPHANSDSMSRAYLNLLNPPRRCRITRAVLYRLGYRLGADKQVGHRFYSKRRLTRGGTHRVTIQVKALSEGQGGWARNTSDLFEVNSREARLIRPGSQDHLDEPRGSGLQFSRVSLIRELRDWERFAIVKRG